MKKDFLLRVVFAMIVLSACKNSDKNTQTIESNSDTIQTPKTPSKPAQVTTTNFDINSIPVSTAVLGEFPFFHLPQGLESQNQPIFRSFDRLFFPIDGIMSPIEGKVWKSYIVVRSDSKESWSLPYFEKSFDDAIKNVGGVKTFDGRITMEEMNRIKEQATYLGEEGSIDYWNEPVKVYVIRRENGEDIYIQLSGSTASGQLQILQKAPFKQTITLLKSTQIKKDLDEKGKSVLHINFDTDKATLTPDGEEAVAEIVKVLEADKNMKLTINGYTDNMGNDVHNLQLSKERAETVKNRIINAGVDKQRLSSAGFGTHNPIADNSTEDGKAQNRRVELVKI